MTKAEEAALKAYPPSLEIYPQVPSATVVDFKPEVRDWNMLNRQRFMEGYEAAEKDLALTWEDVQLLDHFVLELVREEKEGKDWGDGKEFYTEVLTRFKQFKETKDGNDTIHP